MRSRLCAVAAAVLLAAAPAVWSQLSVDLDASTPEIAGSQSIRIRGVLAEETYWTAVFVWNPVTLSFDLYDYYPNESGGPECAEEDRCGNGIDDDCDGMVDEGCGNPCGGIAGLPCEQGEMCLFTRDTCSIVDNMGVCTPIPETCVAVWAPVCGCDGVTYPNECVMIMTGVSMRHVGECRSD